MQNNSRIGTLLLLVLAMLTAIDAQMVLFPKSQSTKLENQTQSTSILARVVHDPDDGKPPKEEKLAG